MLYLQLFYSFLLIGVTGFGGGYAMLSLIQTEVVTKHAWIDPAQFADIVAISQMTPGPVSINCATYIGYTTTHSVAGAAIATLGVCLPSIILMFLGSYFFMKLNGNQMVKNVMRFLRPIIIGLILAAALMLMNKENFIDYRSMLIFAGTILLGLKKVNPILLIAIAGICGVIIF